MNLMVYIPISAVRQCLHAWSTAVNLYFVFQVPTHLFHHERLNSPDGLNRFMKNVLKNLNNPI